jgi:DNA-directed RNA polymerase specialized sigma24 family protein
MTVTTGRMVNEAFRILRKRVRVFARRHAANPDDIDDMTNDACEKAFRLFSSMTANVELNQDNLVQFMAAAYRRAATALHGARIDQFRKSEIQRRFFESASPDLIADTWLGGAHHVPAPDQRLIVAQTMASVLRHSTTAGQRRLGEALQRHVDNGDFNLLPAELAEEAQQSANCRHAWARKLKTKQLG